LYSFEFLYSIGDQYAIMKSNYRGEQLIILAYCFAFFFCIRLPLEKVCEDHDSIINIRNNEQSEILMSLEDYNALEETAYLLKSPTTARSIPAEDSRRYNQRAKIASSRQ